MFVVFVFFWSTGRLVNWSTGVIKNTRIKAGAKLRKIFHIRKRARTFFNKKLFLLAYMGFFL